MCNEITVSLVELSRRRFQTNIETVINLIKIVGITTVTSFGAGIEIFSSV
jgi:hypothetical protein